MREVWTSDPCTYHKNLVKFCFKILQLLFMVWEAVSKWVQKNSVVPCLFNAPFGVWISWWNTSSCVWYRAFFNWVSKVILQLLWFCIATLCDWLKNLTPLLRPIRSKTKTNRDLLARVFPRLARATCICFELWLVHMIVYDCCDWSE